MSFEKMCEILNQIRKQQLEDLEETMKGILESLEIDPEKEKLTQDESFQALKIAC